MQHGSSRTRFKIHLVKQRKFLSCDLLLTNYNWKSEILVAPDIINYGIEAIISHCFPNGKEKPITRASGSINPTECRWG